MTAHAGDRARSTHYGCIWIHIPALCLSETGALWREKAGGAFLEASGPSSALAKSLPQWLPGALALSAGQRAQQSPVCIQKPPTKISLGFGCRYLPWMPSGSKFVARILGIDVRSRCGPRV
eukprot:8222192-Pyramimonas_sp.AAC.2